MKTSKEFLEHKAYKMRLNSLRMTTAAGSGHPTSALSAADIVAALFFEIMDYDITHPGAPDKDHFILSKGHASPILYAAWRELGALNDADLQTYRQLGSVLEGHPTPRFSYAEAATGSLGIGLSIGFGMALNAKREGFKSRTYVLMGDSEMSEGSVWEAAELGAYYKLDNLVGIIDINRLGQTGETMQGWDLSKFYSKWAGFGWHVIEVDGHDIMAIVDVFNQARQIKDKPVMILAKTVKGYGLAAVENKNGFHGKAFSKTELVEYERQLAERFPAAAAYNAPEVSYRGITPRASFKEIKVDVSGCGYQIGESVPTRKAFGNALVAYGKQVPEIVVLDAEVKNSTYTEFFEKQFPNRFVECFIAEQAMIGAATGFANEGKIPVAATFGAFFTRAHDQIRMAAIGRAPLRLVGSHAGVSIGEDGPSQMALEDIAMMRAIPDSVVLYPCDAVSTHKLTGLMIENNQGITYLRTTRMATPVIYMDDEKFEVGGCKILKQSDSDQVCIIAAGVTLFEALKAHDELKNRGINACVIDAYSIKPLASQTIIETARKSGGRIITVEDHYLEGGLGEAVCYAARSKCFQVTCLAVTQLPRSGSPEELMGFAQIDSAVIVRVAQSLVKE